MAVEHLLNVPDEALEIDGQLHASVPRPHHLCAQDAQILLKLQVQTGSKAQPIMGTYRQSLFQLFLHPSPLQHILFNKAQQRAGARCVTKGMQ